jgi:uncharacterized protein (TIGR02679 family)
MIPAGALAYLKSPALRPLWTAAHARLAGNGRTAAGRLTLTGLDVEQREALGHLLDRVVAARCTIELDKLDQRLRATATGTGLLSVVEAVVGPVPDRRAQAAADRARRALLRDQAHAALVAAGLGDSAWALSWLEHVSRQGLPAGVADQAAGTLGLTIGAQAGTWSRGELAQTVTGSAHGLDDDTALARVVLRGLALALNGSAELPAGAAERRALWDAAGVAGDTIATTVLTCGLRPADDEWLRRRADGGVETHLTLREVRRLSPLRLPAGTVYVCENPRVLEAVLDSGSGVPVVCTMGNPTTVTLALLDAVTAAGQVGLAYHGDFDWPGVSIAERIMRRYRARPWLFTAADYREAVDQAERRGTPRQPLAGRAVETPWDPGLAAAMSELGVSIHEEALIESLLLDLRHSR